MTHAHSYKLHQPLNESSAEGPADPSGSSTAPYVELQETKLQPPPRKQRYGLFAHEDIKARLQSLISDIDKLRQLRIAIEKAQLQVKFDLNEGDFKQLAILANNALHDGLVQKRLRALGVFGGTTIGFTGGSSAGAGAAFATVACLRPDLALIKVPADACCFGLEIGALWGILLGLACGAAAALYICCKTEEREQKLKELQLTINEVTPYFEQWREALETSRKEAQEIRAKQIGEIAHSIQEGSQPKPRYLLIG